MTTDEQKQDNILNSEQAPPEASPPLQESREEEAKRVAIETVMKNMQEQEGADRRGKKSAKRELMEWTVWFVAALIIALGIRYFVFEPTIVDGPSMEHTLFNNETVLVAKINYYFVKPQRGEVVTFKIGGEGDTLVKRVVALPGERVKLVSGIVYINGEPLDEPYLVNRGRSDLSEITVPEGCYFVCGDNRENSKDSRNFGPVDKKHIIGRATSVLWPFGEMRWIK